MNDEYVKLRRGRWIAMRDNQPISRDKLYTCSECEAWWKIGWKFKWNLTNYCPNCGAKMENPEGD